MQAFKKKSYTPLITFNNYPRMADTAKDDSVHPRNISL